MLDEYDDPHTDQHQATDETPRRQADPATAGVRRELYSALMSGFGPSEQHGLERLMHDNEERLRETGDGYAP